ncbi:hypothetical protein L6R53_01785 [Myxococcota bacterium]|nr:hypothetical protein [Myxococcota bacterium]
MPPPRALIRLVPPLRLLGGLCLVGALACLGGKVLLDEGHRLVQALLMGLMILLGGGWGAALALRLLITGSARFVGVHPGQVLLGPAASQDDWQVRVLGGAFLLPALLAMALGLGLLASTMGGAIQGQGPTSPPASAPPARRR